MIQILRDAWVLLALAFGHLMLTFLFVTFVPSAYIMHKVKSQPELQATFQELTEFAEKNSELGWDDFMAQRGSQVSTLLKIVPWAGIAFVGSLLIYPFIGWWAGKLLHYPQASGFLVITSIMTQQNVALVPLNIQYRNIAEVALSLPVVMLLIIFQMALLTGGIMTQRGQALLEKSKSEES